MTLEIFTPEKKVYAGKVKAVTLPGSKSPFMVLRNHAPIISSLTKGKVVVLSANDEELDFKVSGGVVEVKRNKITILANL